MVTSSLPPIMHKTSCIPDDMALVGGEIEKALTSTDRYYNRLLEHRILYADGNVGYISVNVNLERDDQGNIARFYGANQDITTQKAAEATLAKQAEELQTVAEVATNVASAMDEKALLQNVVDLTKERFALYHAHIYLLDEANENLVLAAGADAVGQQMVADGRFHSAESRTVTGGTRRPYRARRYC